MSKAPLELLNVDEAARFLGVSRPTFNKIRKERGLKEVKIGKRSRFLKEDLISLLTITEKELPKNYNVFNDFEISDLEVRRNVFDLRSLEQIDSYGVLSLLCNLIVRAQNGDSIELLIEDNQICQYLKANQFFYELERECKDKITWNKHALTGPAYQDLNTLMPIRGIRAKGGERTIAEELLKLLRKQGFKDSVGRSIGQIIGELADNAMTHSKENISERVCYVSAKRFMLQGSDCIIVGIADTGLGIQKSLKTNQKHKSLSDQKALLEAFRPYVSSWEDSAKRGKGLTDVLSIAMGNHSYLRVDSNDIGLFFDFQNKNDEKISFRNPITDVTGTRFGLVLVDTNFEKCEREDVDTLIKKRTTHL